MWGGIQALEDSGTEEATTVRGFLEEALCLQGSRLQSRESRREEGAPGRGAEMELISQEGKHEGEGSKARGVWAVDPLTSLSLSFVIQLQFMAGSPHSRHCAKCFA